MRWVNKETRERKAARKKKPRKFGHEKKGSGYGNQPRFKIDGIVTRL